MEPRNKMPLYKWFIIGGSSLVLLIATVVTVILLSQTAVVSQNIKANTSDPSALSETSAKIHNPDSEVRGVWIASVENINFPSKQGLSADELKAELDDIIQTVSELNMNAIYFQVRPSADALYDSAYFPVSEFLTGKQGSVFPNGFDPLRYIVENAHRFDIAVHAWVNPLRITTGTADNPQHSVEALAETNPARQYPQWTVPYADGKLYFNAGLPKVRKLIADGVAEIVRNYDVDGIIFDDYFYPYPVTGKTFDDASAFAEYGSGFKNIDDWRRENVNLMVKGCYEAIKAENPNCEFGIAPFGIWQNDNGSNGGSDTKGLSSYSAIYCDSLAWVKGGYIDYIAPQIYWQFSTSAARYDVLVRWWNEQLEPYPNVDLMICHAAYRSDEWKTQNEIRNQVEFARSELKYKGSIMYGYASIKADEFNLQNQLIEAFADEYAYPQIMSNGSALSVSSPANGAYINYDHTYIIGSSDPAYPLYIDGKAVGRTKQGYFSLYVPLAKGKNTFVFSHKGIETVYTVNRGYTYAEDPGYTSLDGYTLTVNSPKNNYMVAGGTTISFSVTAPSGSTVAASLNGQTFRLSPTVNPPGNSAYMREVYTGSMTLPKSAADGEIVDLGNITYHAVRGNESASAAGVNVRVAGAGASVPVIVANDYSEVKISTDSWFYDDYTPASKGMMDNAVSLSDGYYKLRFGGYIAESDVEETWGYVPVAEINYAHIQVDSDYTALYIKASQRVPVNANMENGSLAITLYNVNTNTAKDVEFYDNPILKSVTHKNHTKANAHKYYCNLINTDNFYGFKVMYYKDYIVIMFRNPQRLPYNNRPLEGKTIILDAGHGGADTGAAGPDSTYNEADMNLDIVLSARNKLEALGADVLLTRSEDTAVDIYYRMDYLTEIEPDLAVSVHQNSMVYNSDIRKIRGTVALYWSDSGVMLTKSVSEALADSLNRLERTPAQQRLAMVRNPRFPSTLVEVGFITCVEEYDYMRRSGTIEKAAQGICDGILSFYNNQAKYLK